jgi:subtilisin family serine protease
MKTKHVILRRIESPRPIMTGKGLGSQTKDTTNVFAKVEFEDLAVQNIAEVAKKKDIEAIAPVIPMKLIKPVFISETAPKANETAWGVKAVCADTSPFTGEGVIVAVLDTGIDSTHPAFNGINFIRKNFTSEADEDLHGHGTHCAGTIFGRNIDGKRIGIAQGVQTAIIGKILGDGGGGSDVVLQAIEWALQNGAQIISMSLGIDFPGYVAELIRQGIPAELATSMALQGYSANIYLFERLAALIDARGMFMQPCLLIAAAGNESRRDENPDFEIAVSPPAAAIGIISVAALDLGQTGLTIAPFSNVGARVSGPGVNVLSARRGGGLVTMSGTSMATPHVAGVAALWAQKLKSSGQLNGRIFMDRLVGSGTTAGLKAGFHPADVGVGIIQAPQN